MDWPAVVVAGVGAFAGLAGALGYGFKLMVDLMGSELKAQRLESDELRKEISEKLTYHIKQCDEYHMNCLKKEARYTDV